jgi:hypothetical protein
MCITPREAEKQRSRRKTYEAAAPMVRLLSFSAGRKPVRRRQQHPDRFP